MSKGEQMPLAMAAGWAEKIVALLTPYCERIEIAGSIRRRRSFCGDVDLVVIPKLHVPKDLLGEAGAPENLLQKFLEEYVRENRPRGAEWLYGETSATVNFRVKLPKCHMEIYCTDAAHFGAVLLTRTGSKEHNIYIGMRARRLGFNWSAARGLTRGNEDRRAKTEEEIYEGLQMSFVRPEEREIHILEKRFGKEH